MADPENRHLRSFLWARTGEPDAQIGAGYFHSKEDRKDQSESNESGYFLYNSRNETSLGILFYTILTSRLCKYFMY